MALVLSRTTGLVSNQFHVKFDPLFHSVEQDLYDSQWQNKAGFIKQEPMSTTQKKAQNRQFVESTIPPAQMATEPRNTEDMTQTSEGANEEPMQRAEGGGNAPDIGNKRKQS